MAEVNVVIDGRAYPIACDDGQERRVQQLGAYIDQRLHEISAGGGGSNKAQLMVLTALLLADEIFDLRDGLNRAVTANEALKNEPRQIVYQGLTAQDEQDLSIAISRIAARVEKMADQTQKA